MNTYRVWDALSEHEAQAKEICHVSPDDAACEYAETDSQGNQEGQYIEKGVNNTPLPDVLKNGRLIYVRDEDNRLYRFRVGIVEYEPRYNAVRVVEE